MYDYMANNEDELTFSKGQLINVLNKDDADWWQGEINGVTGLFPSNYVKMTTDSDPSQQCKQLLFFIIFFCFISTVHLNSSALCLEFGVAGIS